MWLRYTAFMLRLIRPSLLVLLSLPAMTSAQVPPGNREYRIAGSVYKENSDSALADARVQLFDSVGNLVRPILATGGRGDFSFGLFPPGEYAIVVDHDGFQQTRVAVDITRHDESNIIVHLRPFSTDAPPVGSSVTAHELGVPKKARESFEKGMSKLQQKPDYSAAINEFQHAIALYPDYYEAHAQIGLAEIHRKNFSAAEAALRKSIALSSGKYPLPLTLLCMILNDQSRFSDAEPVAQQAVAADSTNWRGPYELARALVALRRLSEAEKAAYSARDLKPDNPDTYLLLIEIHRRTRTPQALLQDFDTYLHLAPQGRAAPEVRKLRDQLVVFLQSHPPAEPKP
jgi:tetratricopeptide (TPR) repeat protein